MFIVYSDAMYTYTLCRYEVLSPMGRDYDVVVRMLVIVLVVVSYIWCIWCMHMCCWRAKIVLVMSSGRVYSLF